MQIVSCYMKYQSLFSGKKYEKYFKMSVTEILTQYTKHQI